MLLTYQKLHVYFVEFIANLVNHRDHNFSVDRWRKSVTLYESRLSYKNAKKAQAFTKIAQVK